MSRAFDAERAPELDLIEDCVHCGFCLPTCPTYALWDEEMDSPRGRIVLMKAGLEEGSELSPEMVEHWDRCLGCMACVTACPSGVQYDKLIEDTRAQVERNHDRSLWERLKRRALFALFPHPGRLRPLAPLARLHPLGPRIGLRQALRQLPERFPAVGERRGTVALLQGCVQRALFGEVNEATAQALAAEGFEVRAPRAPRCCGALQLHAGDDARPLAKAAIEALEGYDAVVVNAAGCGSGMKDYPHLLREEPGWAERADAFAAKVRDATELLGEVEPRAERAPLPLKVAYHDPCHLAHAQGIREQPRELLRGIPELELVEPNEWELCCGSAGIYNLVQPDAASELGERKARNLLETGAELVAAANPGCVLQIAAHTKRLGREVRVIHPMELLWKSIEEAGNGKR
jgi:glycolate dehydrogenase iron-sulfur subunit